MKILLLLDVIMLESLILCKSCFRGAFMFLKPSLSAVSVIYELPFSTSVWITYIVAVTILAVVFMLTWTVHHNISLSAEHCITWGDTIMDALAIVCQQGYLFSYICNILSDI